MENKITTYGYVFSHTHVTKNDICSAVLVLYCCSQSECFPVLFNYLNCFLIEWHCIVYRWKAIPTVISDQMEELYSKYYILRTYFSHISVIFLSNGMLLYTIGKPLLMPIQWYRSHIPTIRNAKAIFKIQHFSHLFLKYLGCFLIKWYTIISRWKARFNPYPMVLLSYFHSQKYKSYIQNTPFYCV